MRNKFIIPILTLALVAVAGWGYSQYQTKRQWEISAENQYQRAFEELTAHVSNMESEMSKAMVAGSFSQSVKSLTNVWREAASSQDNLGQLPLTAVELSRTKTALAKAGAFSFTTAQQRLTKGTPPTESEWQTLKKMREQTRIVARNLLQMRDQFYSNRAQWLTVDRLGALGAAGFARGSRETNQVTKSFIMLEDGLRRSPDVQFDGNTLDFVPKATGLTGGNISSRDALLVARRILGPQWQRATYKNDRIIRGGFPSYSVSVTDQQNRNCQLSVSVKGGHLVWMLANRDVSSSKLTMDQCAARGDAFLSRNGYPPLTKLSQQTAANVATISYAPLRDKVIYYPELIKVQVARDNGDILGVDSVSYLTFNNPKTPQPGAPKYSETQIRKLLNPHLQPARIRLAQVLDEMYNKVLCYEVDGKETDQRYLVYYNAQTGKEEKIRRVDANGNEVM